MTKEAMQIFAGGKYLLVTPDGRVLRHSDPFVLAVAAAEKLSQPAPVQPITIPRS